MRRIFFRALAFIGLVLGLSPTFASDTAKVNLDKRNTVKTVNLLINNERTAVLKGPVRQDNTGAIIDQLKEFAEASNDNIYLIINSPGGSVVDGFELVNTMQAIQTRKGIKIYCAVESEAYSMAAIIAQFCTRTYMHKDSNIMFHQASFGLQGEALQVLNRAAFMQRYLRSLNERIAQQMGLSTELYENIIVGEWWMTAKEAAQFGVVDGILDTLYYTAKPPEVNPFKIIFGMEKEPNVVVNPLKEPLKDGNVRRN